MASASKTPNSPITPDKALILAELRRLVHADLEAVAASQQETQAGATHEESKPENDKDTRALESSYLARGLARRVGELQEAATLLEALVPRPFGDEAPIALSALVIVEDDDGGFRYYFVAPGGGGLKLQAEGVEVAIVTPQSPLGRALIGKCVDDDIELRSPQGLREFSVVSVT